MQMRRHEATGVKLIRHNKDEDRSKFAPVLKLQSQACSWSLLCGQSIFVGPLMNFPYAVVGNLLPEAGHGANLSAGQTIPSRSLVGAVSEGQPWFCKNHRPQLAHRLGTKPFCKPFIYKTGDRSQFLHKSGRF